MGRPMHARITTSGGRSYPQLVEGHRDAQGKIRIRVVANLGRLDLLSPATLDPLINGLNRAVGRLENTADEITHEPARAFGHVFVLHELWKDLGFDRALARSLRSGKRKLDVEASPLSLGVAHRGAIGPSPMANAVHGAADGEPSRRHRFEPDGERARPAGRGAGRRWTSGCSGGRMARGRSAAPAWVTSRWSWPCWSRVRRCHRCSDRWRAHASPSMKPGRGNRLRMKGRR